MENDIKICTNCANSTLKKLDKRKDGSTINCCDKPNYIPLSEYLLHSQYRPNIINNCTQCDRNCCPKFKE